MKEKELKFGIYKSGKFIFSIQRLTFDTGSASDSLFFEVLVSQVKEYKVLEIKKNYTIYINLVEDIRFNLFGDYPKFNRPIKTEELIEYNTYVQRRFSNPKGELITMPLWRLSRSTLTDMINIAGQIKS